MSLTFQELARKAKDKAIKEYQKGWNETHPNEKLPKSEIEDILKYDLKDEVYTKTGKLKEA